MQTASLIFFSYRSLIFLRQLSSNSSVFEYCFSSFILDFPKISASCSWPSMIVLIASWAMSSAFNIVSSGTSLDSPSIIIIESFVPAIIKFNWVFSNSWGPGLIINSFSTNPILTAPMGHWKGISDIHKAAEAPIMASMSGKFFWSYDKTVAMTWTSFLYSLGNKGRNGRSISLEVNMAFLLGLPSLLKKPPGILPAA